MTKVEVKRSRTENMQAYVDHLAWRIKEHGKYLDSQDQRMENMIKAVEEPERFSCDDEQNSYYWKQFAQDQIENGREFVAEVMEKAPYLLDDEKIGFIVKVIMGGWEYGERFLQLFQQGEDK